MKSATTHKEVDDIYNEALNRGIKEKYLFPTYSKRHKELDEEKVIREGVAAIGEGLAGLSEQFTELRVKDILRLPEVEKSFREDFGVGVNSIDEAIQRAVANVDSSNELSDEDKKEWKRLLESSLKFESTRAILESYITPKSETNPEVELPPVVEEVQPEDIEEESVSNEQETQGKLSDANREDNSVTFDKVEISGFSKKDFNFYLFSNATFELGLG
jgi:hypothetical protein